jgi:hypothetical protein
MERPCFCFFLVCVRVSNQGLTSTGFGVSMVSGFGDKGFCVVHDVQRDTKSNAMSVHVAAVDDDEGIYDLDSNQIVATLIFYRGINFSPLSSAS